MIRAFLRWIDFRCRNVKVWPGAYVYPTAKIGDNVSIGRNAEVGNNVKIGENTKIGAGAFIPEGVTIGKGCFIGPHAVFSNDMYPPAPKAQWEKTVVHDRASIGAGARIRPGIVIKHGALVGMGAVVTHNVEVNEIVAGVPARKIGEKNNGRKDMGKPYAVGDETVRLHKKDR